MEKRNVFDEAASLTEFWSQRTLQESNGTLLKVAKGLDSTRWHSHDDQDETFLLLSGRLVVQLRDGDVELNPGDLLTVPQGVEHCPVAPEEARFLILGKTVTSNTAGGKPEWSHAEGSL
ncbi:cupin domain-containing protein [Brevibacterium aurantiacum]|uniref:Cupin domain-containing protein n=1 Tax=Brevibacterium aurantiacum TaxID=273384 RepID=A0A556C3V7_BREAU|nr:cupin domain-containing protein [Brevibacterium aurantiacum]TSI12135.1 cupin domain-containing protein [Brevibacterium aurantiacum]